MHYAGDVSVQEAWKLLNEDDNCFLVDVRTQAEWTFVGVVDLGQAGKNPAMVEWQSFPGMHANPHFMEAIDSFGFEKDKTKILFLCRSGARSAAAAALATRNGYTQCYNIIGGFEGDPDSARHRGRVNGWKAADLPWAQG